jgi:hypothetical protein
VNPYSFTRAQGYIEQWNKNAQRHHWRGRYELIDPEEYTPLMFENEQWVGGANGN